MRKILFFINTLQGGGAEKALVNLLQCIDNEKYVVTLVTVSGGYYEKELPDKIKYRQLVRGNSWLSKQLAKVIYHLPHWFVNALVTKGNYDVEVAYLEGFPTRVIAAGQSNAKKIAFVHCDVSVAPIVKQFYMHRKMCHDEYLKYDNVFFVSEAAKRGFEGTIGRLSNSSVVCNVINYQEIKEKAQLHADVEFDTDGIKIVCVGRLSKEKAFDRVVRIATKLEARYRFQIYILGDGNQRPVLEELIAENNTQSVKLLGFQQNPFPCMKQADFLLCSSLFEGYSTVVAESLFLGVPVLTTRCAGMDELLENGRMGMIVDNDEEALCRGIETILKNPDILRKYKEILQSKKQGGTLPGGAVAIEKILGK